MLQVNNLSYCYPNNSSNTLYDLSFSIQRGEIFGFLGPSGSGKSTTQKILYKLLTRFMGEILFEGKSLENWGREFYERIGVSFELPNHYIKLTAEENLRFFSSFYRNGNDRIPELLKRVGLHAEQDIKKPVSEFSKGMKMRLNFIRSLLHDPDVFFFDEPTSGLDPIFAGKIKKMILELKDQGKTVFLTTHNMFDADQLCDRVALLHHGKILAMDTPYNLKLQHGQATVKIIRKDVNHSELEFPMKGLSENKDFLEVLKNDDIASIHSQEATLEEVFVKITGDQLV